MILRFPLSLSHRTWHRRSICNFWFIDLPVNRTKHMSPRANLHASPVGRIRSWSLEPQLSLPSLQDRRFWGHCLRGTRTGQLGRSCVAELGGAVQLCGSGSRVSPGLSPPLTSVLAPPSSFPVLSPHECLRGRPRVETSEGGGRRQVSGVSYEVARISSSLIGFKKGDRDPIRIGSKNRGVDEHREPSGRELQPGGGRQACKDQPGDPSISPEGPPRKPQVVLSSRPTPPAERPASLSFAAFHASCLWA